MSVVTLCISYPLNDTRVIIHQEEELGTLQLYRVTYAFTLFSVSRFILNLTSL